MSNFSATSDFSLAPGVKLFCERDMVKLKEGYRPESFTCPETGKASPTISVATDSKKTIQVFRELLTEIRSDYLTALFMVGDTEKSTKKYRRDEIHPSEFDEFLRDHDREIMGDSSLFMSVFPFSSQMNNQPEVQLIQSKVIDTYNRSGSFEKVLRSVGLQIDPDLVLVRDLPHLRYRNTLVDRQTRSLIQKLEAELIEPQSFD